MTTICPILKAPRVGQVKTRLGREVGHERATQIYRALVERQLRAIPRDWLTSVHFAPQDALSEMREWLAPLATPKHRFTPQVDGNLGTRLIAALQFEFGSESPEVFLVGGDCPSIDQKYLEEASLLLKTHPVVIGPAHDGGYVLIGLNSPHLGLFQNINWSTSVVFSQTMEQAEELGLKVALLPTLEDIDDLDSLNRYGEFLG